MKQLVSGLALVGILGSSSVAQEDAGSVQRPADLLFLPNPQRDYAYRLGSMIWVSHLLQRPWPQERCVQFSSYDRASSPATARGQRFYANHDRGHYLRTESRDGATEYVMVDAAGHGCLTRLWSANPSGTLHFDVDGKRVWSVDFAELCQGKVAGVPPAVAWMRARGGNVYLPVPFGKRLVVSATVGDLYYLADVVLDERVTATSFTPELLVAEQPRAAMRDLVEHRARAPADRVVGRRIRAGKEHVLEIPAEHEVQYVEVALRAGRDRKDLAEQLQRVRLVVTAGDETTVDVPLPAFFASRDWRPWRSDQLGVGEDGVAWCHWPMPMLQKGRIALAFDGPLEGVELELAASFEEMENWVDRPENRPRFYELKFRASYHQVRGVATRPFTDHVVLDATGAGRFVGCSLLVRNPSKIWWGEGDEKAYVDGETFPSWFGTGTEDYFGYAWCDPTVFSAPFHAQIQCDGPQNFGFTQLFRSHVLDNIPFHRSLRFELERWHWVKDIEMDYTTVAYWYGAKGAKSGLPPVPPVGERYLEPLELPKMLVVEGAIEGESLRVVSCSGGTHQVQDLSFFEGAFSRNAHRWWRDGKKGDVLVLAVPVAEAGDYAVTLAMTRARDFGRVKVSLAGQKLGSVFDGYAKDVGSSGPFAAGTVSLTQGDHELRFELVGSNPAAQKRLMVGLDYLILEKR